MSMNIQMNKPSLPQSTFSFTIHISYSNPHCHSQSTFPTPIHIVIHNPHFLPQSTLSLRSHSISEPNSAQAAANSKFSCIESRPKGRLAHLVSWFAYNAKVIVEASLYPLVSLFEIAVTKSRIESSSKQKLTFYHQLIN